MFSHKALLPIVFAAISVLAIVIFSGLMLGTRMAERDNLRAQHSLGTDASDVEN